MDSPYLNPGPWQRLQTNWIRMKTRAIPKDLSKTITEGACEDCLKHVFHWRERVVTVAAGSLIWDDVDVAYGMGRGLWVYWELWQEFHIRRLLSRLGVTQAGISPAQVESILNSLVRKTMELFRERGGGGISGVSHRPSELDPGAQRQWWRTREKF